jgi:MoaA/NifB/PqqE/SkfB family radical SAM enzyme
VPLSPQRKEQLLAIESRLQEHAFPPQLVVENTSHCNLKCVHCCHKELLRPRRHMERVLWDKIADEVARERPDCEVWPTFYGEALIMGKDGEIWDRIDYAARAGCRNLVLNSNGTLLTKWDNITRVLASPLRRFILSLDGFTRETFEAIRVGACRDEVFAAVEELLNRKARFGQTYPAIICQYSVMDENEAEVEAFRAYWRERGAEIKTRPKLEWTTTGSVRASNIDHDTDFRIACPWANNTMAIHQNGNAVACAVDYEGRYTVGSVADTSVKELWIRLGQLRAIHRARDWDRLPELCRPCCDWQTAGAEYEEERAPGTRPFWLQP